MCGTTATERLSDVQARCDDPQDPSPHADWQTEALIAADLGLLVLTGNDADRTVTRTEFGDAWAATFDPSDLFAKVPDRWPLPGPGKFEVDYFPLTKRPDFSVFALTGPAVASVHQGGWNLVNGFGQPEPNPVSAVEMHSTLDDGTKISVQSADGDISALPLHLADPSTHHAVIEQLTAATIAKSAPWQIRPLDVDGHHREFLVLDLRSEALPEGVTGPALLAFTQLDDTQITIVCDDPRVNVALARIASVDLLGPKIGAAGP